MAVLVSNSHWVESILEKVENNCLLGFLSTVLAGTMFRNDQLWWLVYCLEAYVYAAQFVEGWFSSLQGAALP